MPEAIYTARPLTDEEKIFAEKNHNLMYRYIRIHELDLEDWYDILIIPYLQAVTSTTDINRATFLIFRQMYLFNIFFP